MKAPSSPVAANCDTFPSNTGLHAAEAKEYPEDASIVILGWNEFDSEEDYLAFLREKGDRTIFWDSFLGALDLYLKSEYQFIGRFPLEIVPRR